MCSLVLKYLGDQLMIVRDDNFFFLERFDCILTNAN